MKKNIRAEAVSLLLSDFSKEFLQDKLNSIFESNRYSINDCQLLTNLVFGVLRNKLFLDAIINTFSRKAVKKFLLPFLEVAIYQNLFLNKIPEHAISAEMMKSADFFKLNINIKKFLRGVLSSYFKNCSKFELNGDFSNSLPLHIRYSHPEWIIDEWRKFLSDDEILKCLVADNNVPNFLIFPVHTFPNDEFLKFLHSNQIEYIKNDKGVILSRLTTEIKNLLKEGRIYVQGFHQYQSIRLCPADKGDLILEVGGAPGGKTIYLSEIVGKEGKVFSIDKNQERFTLLQERVNLMSLENVSCVLHDVLNTYPKNLPDLFDHIVLDPPCSNLGELCRRPEARYRENKESINSLSLIQKDIVTHTWGKLKVGGTLLYITCTLSYTENQGIKEFIKNSFKGCVLNELLTLPIMNNQSGGYACLFKKEQ